MTEKDLESQSEKMMSDDEEIIELTDEVPISDEDEVIELTEVASASEGDEVIELTDVVDGGDEVIELTDVVDGEDEVIELTDRVSDSSTDSSEEAVSDSANTLPVGAITPEQINVALERTIEKLYGQKIESLLVEIVQKKVSDEIEKIKKMILDGSSDNEG